MIFANIAQISNMDNIYMFMLIAITVLATIDIVVGVSNDAINFLNSAIGSKAISMRTIMIVASLGIFVGIAVSFQGFCVAVLSPSTAWFFLRLLHTHPERFGACKAQMQTRDLPQA